MGSLDTVQNGKGSKPRPIVNKKQFNSEFDRIFKKKNKKTVDSSKKSDKTEEL